ncbi:peptidoglycan recognition protein family protein [Virgibacillus flavescens]|uniref:peptidoglycan recognition protein family protein n=1 Tax=Virgibacillus flavescens TaxID=1611422 RepID=UPI003D32612E
MAIKDKYKIERRYITNELARSGEKLESGDPEFFVAHETANNGATADNHYTYFQNITFQASAHTMIDSTKILEIIPLDEKAWHVQYQKTIDNMLYGDDANDAAIGVELCRTDDFSKSYDRYRWYFAFLCTKFNKNPKEHIVSHSVLDPQRRNDPQSWLTPHGITWSEFISDVQYYLDNWNVEINPDRNYLMRGDRGEDVKVMQRKLIELGYDLGGFGADGSYGPVTEKAVKKFQSDRGLIVDGFYGPITQKALKNAKPKSKLDVDGYFGVNTISALQNYFNTPVDGVISKPSLVIKALQRWLGVKEDGYIGRITITALQKRLGTPIDGFISKPSLVIMELQRRLNKGKL